MYGLPKELCSRIIIWKKKTAKKGFTKIREAFKYLMERAMGIEPTSKAWEAFILPMNYARSNWYSIMLT